MARPSGTLSVSLLLWSAMAIAFSGQRTVPAAEGAHILALEPNGGRSHWNFMSAVLRSLTEAGHAVTVFTPFPEGGHRANYTEVDTSARVEITVGLGLVDMVDRFSGPVSLMSGISEYSRRHCDVIYENPRFVELTRNNTGHDRFDVIIAEPLMLDCMSYAAHALDLPLIYAIPSPMFTVVERDFTGHASNPACVSNVLAPHAVPKSFVQRFTNTAMSVYTAFLRSYREWRLRVADPRPYDSSPAVKPAIIFQNTYHGTEAPRPIAPNLVDVGGIHLRPAKSIPKDILDFIEQSPHGVILFTFGSTVQPSSLPMHIKNAFKAVFAKIPQRVLWKYDGESEDLPKNVMAKKWFPQREILLHPNVKLFISHGGISGMYEVLDAGVPVLGFPLFYDQPRNIDNLVNAEMAISMDLLSVSEDSLLNSLLELTNNEKYMRNAKITSNRFRDRPISPEQSVVYWTEYVIRHKGAPHLRSHGYNLSWYQYFLLDVILVVLIIICLFLYVSFKAYNIYCNYSLKFSLYSKVKTQ